MTDHLGETWYLARTPAHCDACGGVIGAGDPHIRTRYLDGGRGRQHRTERWTWKSHTLCDALHRWLIIEGIDPRYGMDDGLLYMLPGLILAWFRALAVAAGHDVPEVVWW